MDRHPGGSTVRLRFLRVLGPTMLVAGTLLAVGCSDLDVDGDSATRSTPSQRPAETSVGFTGEPVTNVPELVERTGGAVVRIDTPTGMGSGFIIDPDGHIITNHHVIARTRGVANAIEVTLADGGVHTAQVVGLDPAADLAVIRIDAGEALDSLELAQLADVAVGESVVAIGFPLGLEGGEGAGFTVTTGIVSQTNRAIGGVRPILGAVQTDAAINHGNSGGPLLNMKGQVIGVNTSLQEDTTTGGAAQGIGYAVGADTIRVVYEEIRATGEVKRALLGVQGFEALRPAQAEALGLPRDTAGVHLAAATSVATNGPASSAGLQRGDVLVRIGDRVIANEGDLVVAMIEADPGDTVVVEYFRDGELQTAEVTLGNGSI